MALEQKEVLEMIANRPAAGGEPGEIDYESEDFANSDALDESDYAQSDAEVTTEEGAAEETPVVEDKTDWRAIAKQQQDELEKYRQESAVREEADYERRRDELTGDERTKFVEDHWRNKDRARQVESLRKDLAESHPVSTVLFGALGQEFNIDIEDPVRYRASMDHLEERWGGLLSGLIADGVKAEMEKFYTERGVEWGVQKLGGSTPRPLKPRDPARAQYEARRQELMKPGAAKTVDDIAATIRARQNAKRSK
jgi:hypothetical protein